MKKYILGVSFMIAVVVMGIAACSKSGSNDPAPTKSTTPTAPTTGGASVSISGFAFSPASVTIKAGEAVKWTNADTAPHTATDVAGSFDSGMLNQSGSFSHTFATAGTYTYKCVIHSTMATATVVVQ
ncbi:plastocyanin/azurin family copper-binding protein [Mucilaginibacter sp. RB4R14]|uniref:plastocyanin/azurin family copper-binding protein n=1 Tax=Mucilaginibacter aurantiaciroseus TaxID=2949308 RepID=UPI002091238E|nr:plastocyanin/azurin family copper-binding protein [Mucilaginibacter aurantiaciroseus]MCO5934364.1 plastocyanin/azurin family copper-binding protein [Mucilaginibacter aurantiaciroseus]